MHVPLSGSWFSGLPGLRSLSPADKSCIISSLAQMITWPQYYLFNYYCTLTLCLQFRHFHRWQIFWCLLQAMESKVVLPYILFALIQIAGLRGRGKAMSIWMEIHLCASEQYIRTKYWVWCFGSNFLLVDFHSKLALNVWKCPINTIYWSQNVMTCCW